MRGNKWFKELTDEQRSKFWEMRDEALEEGRSDGRDEGRQKQGDNDLAAIILTLRHDYGYTDQEIGLFIARFNRTIDDKLIDEYAVRQTLEMWRDKADAIAEEIQDRL